MGIDSQRPLKLQIHERLAAYVAGELSREAFRTWFVPNALVVARDLGHDPATQELIYTIELRMAEMDQEGCSETDIRDELRPLAQNYTIPYDVDKPTLFQTRAGSAATSVVEWEVSMSTFHALTPMS